jgi:hypothetical protein
MSISAPFSIPHHKGQTSINSHTKSPLIHNSSFIWIAMRPNKREIKIRQTGRRKSATLKIAPLRIRKIATKIMERKNKKTTKRTHFSATQYAKACYAKSLKSRLLFS